MSEPTAQSPKRGRVFRIAVFLDDSGNPGERLVFGVVS